MAEWKFNKEEGCYMRETILLFVILLFVSGCNVNDPENVKGSEIDVEAVKNEYPVEIKEDEEIFSIDKIEIQLVNPLTDETMREFVPKNIYNKPVYENEISELASELAKEIDQPMKNVKLSDQGELIGGRNRVILNEDELIQILLNIEPNTLTVPLPVYETKPNVSVEMTKNISNTVISKYETFFDPADSGRNQNIQLAVEAINNIVIGPGDRFSYNETLGERTPEQGYQPALEIVNDEYVMGIGGGICQVSSTLFNAVDELGLEVYARSSHSKPVGYVPEGRDATVSWGGPDFKFLNNKDYPVILKAYTDKENGVLTVEFRASKLVAVNQ